MASFKVEKSFYIFVLEKADEMKTLTGGGFTLGFQDDGSILCAGNEIFQKDNFTLDQPRTIYTLQKCIPYQIELSQEDKRCCRKTLRAFGENTYFFYRRNYQFWHKQWTETYFKP